MSNDVLQWGNAVLDRIDPILAPFVLAIIENESGGVAGETANRPTAFSVPLPSSSGGEITTDRALGLMQTIPIVIDDYNATHDGGYTYEDMIGTTYSSGIKQMNVGIWTFLNNINAVERYLNQSLFMNNRLNENLLKLVLVSYSWGIGNLRNKLNVLKDLNLEPTYYNLKATFPELGKPANQPLIFVDRILRKSEKYGNLTVKQIESGASALGLLLLGGLAIWAFKKGLYD